VLRVEHCGKKIKRIRLVKKISQKKLASLADISNCTLSQIENGKRNPSFFTMQNIAKVLQASLDDFV